MTKLKSIRQVQLSLAATGNALIVSILILFSPTIILAQELHLDPAKVLGPDVCGECHKDAIALWKDTKHSSTFSKLPRTDKAREIANKMGIKRIKGITAYDGFILIWNIQTEGQILTRQKRRQCFAIMSGKIERTNTTAFIHPFFNTKFSRSSPAAFGLLSLNPHNSLFPYSQLEELQGQVILFPGKSGTSQGIDQQH